MKLVGVKIRNFRCYKEEVRFEVGNITALIGKNDAGKSAIMDALAVFFDQAKLDSDDACISGDREDVCIACEFSEWPKEVVIDHSNSTTLESEYLLNENGNLEIHKKFNGSLKSPKQMGTYARAIHPFRENVNDLLSLKRTDLLARAEELDVSLDNVEDRRKSALIRSAIWSAISNLEVEPRLVELASDDAKKIWDHLKSELPVFSLFKSDRASTDQDPEAQDPMKMAIDAALKAKEAELQVVAEHVRREVEDIAQRTVEKIREMDPALARELKPRFATPSWRSIFKVSLTDDDQIPINKRGSGVRRLILLNFFRAQAERQVSDHDTSSIIYAIEEPETSQHPNNQRVLIDTLSDIADEPDRQVMISTHTPVLARLLPTRDLRYVAADEEGRHVVLSGTEETMVAISRSLGVLADHDVGLFVGVEGKHDIAFLRRISAILHEADSDCPNLGKLEDEGKLIFFPMGGANLALWASRLKSLRKPEFYLMDSDLCAPGTSVHQHEVDVRNETDGVIARLTAKRELENYLHPKVISDVRPGLTLQFDDYDDVPQMVARALHEASGSETDWDALADGRQKRKMSEAKKWLNRQAVANMTAELLDERDPNGDLKSILMEMGRQLSS